MDLHIGHRMSSASVCSRREPSKIAQGCAPLALGYFRLFPPGRTALNASLFPHLELLETLSSTVPLLRIVVVLRLLLALLHLLLRRARRRTLAESVA
jgi:hypothetical protein